MSYESNLLLFLELASVLKLEQFVESSANAVLQCESDVEETHNSALLKLAIQ